MSHRSSDGTVSITYPSMLFLAGAAFRFWATLYLGGRKDAVVVDTGPYSLCRHPL